MKLDTVLVVHFQVSHSALSADRNAIVSIHHQFINIDRRDESRQIEKLDLFTIRMSENVRTADYRAHANHEDCAAGFGYPRG